MYQATLHHWLILGCTGPASALFQRALYSCPVVLVEGNYRGQSCVHLSVLLVVPLPETQIWNCIWASLFKNKICSCFLCLTLSHPLLWLTSTYHTNPAGSNKHSKPGFSSPADCEKSFFVCVCGRMCVDSDWKNIPTSANMHILSMRELLLAQVCLYTSVCSYSMCMCQHHRSISLCVSWKLTTG